MMLALKIIGCALMGYLMGNLQMAIFISSFFHKSDIRKLGSGNAGSTNMLRVFGVKSGVFTFIGDLLKAVVAVLLTWLIANDADKGILSAVSAFAVVLGHNYPVFFNLKGGKGVACSLGIIWVLAPYPEAAVASAVALLLILTTRTISLAALCGVLAFDILFVVLSSKTAVDIPYYVLFALMTILMFIRHRDNIKRIINGTESKVSLKKKSKE